MSCHIVKPIFTHFKTMELIENETFEKVNYILKPLDKAEYENCIFHNCDFSDSDLKGIIFTECEFKGCNLSMVKPFGSAYKAVRFMDCKILGLHFELCNPLLFEVSFENCALDFSSFFKQNLKKTGFINCSLKGVDFTESNLSGATFDNCDLFDAKFDNTILEKSDFRTALNYAFDLEKNAVKGAKFSKDGVIGLLYKYKLDIQ